MLVTCITVKQITQVSGWTVLYIGSIEKSNLRMSAQSQWTMFRLYVENFFLKIKKNIYGVSYTYMISQT